MVMIPRISLALLVVVLAIINTVNAFLSRGMGLVRFKAVNSITRPFLSTSDESNLPQEDEIKGLKEDVKVLKIKREELLPSDPLYLAFTEEMTAVRNQVTALLTTQQEIKRLKDEIAELKRDLLTVVDSGERTAIRNQMSSYQKDITALRQQGTVASPISFRPFRYLSITSFSQISFNISSSPIQSRQSRKVSDDESSRNIDFYALV
jgi:hypothetical protein